MQGLYTKIPMGTGSSTTTFHIMNLIDWLGTVNNGLRYTEEEKRRYQGLPDEIESDTIPYESLNAGQ